MTRTAIRLLFSSLLFSTAAFPQSRGQIDSLLSATESLFDSGSYISAELQSRRMLEDRSLPDSARVQFEKYVAFSLVAQEKKESAIDHFVDALEIDSTFTLDQVLTSPKILSVFEAARAEFNSEVRKKQAAAAQELLSRRGFPNQAAAGPTYRALLFPGWEQIYEGKRVKGYVLLGAGGIAALSTIALDFLRRDARTKYLDASTPELAESRYSTYNLYYKSEFYSGSAFILIYIYSGLDAFLNLPPYFRFDYSPRTLTESVHLQITF